MGVAASEGYREYKSESDIYNNDILAFTFIELGDVNAKSNHSGKSHRPIHVSHSIREPGVKYTEFATFYIGDSWLGLNTQYISGALSTSEITYIPSSKSAFVGTIIYNGNPIGVLNPYDVVGKDRKSFPKISRVLVIKTDKGEAGIIIEGLGEIPEIANHRIVKDNFFENSDKKYIEAIIQPSGKDDDDRILIIVDPSNFVQAILSQENTLEQLERIKEMSNNKTEALSGNFQLGGDHKKRA